MQIFRDISNTSDKKPPTGTTDQIETDIQTGTFRNLRKYFSIDLNLLMERQRSVPGLEELQIPFVVFWCSSLIRIHFLEEEGLFRISPAHSDLLSVQEQIENSVDEGRGYLTQLTPENSTVFKPHIFAGLLKKFLRDLPSPLLGSENYTTLIGIARQISQPGRTEEVCSQLKDLFGKYSDNQYHLLRHVIELSYETSCFHEQNKMTSSNVSRVIGPNILWNNDITDPMETTQHIGLINLLTEFMINHSKEIFGEPFLSESFSLLNSEILEPTDSLLEDCTEESDHSETGQLFTVSSTLDGEHSDQDESESFIGEPSE